MSHADRQRYQRELHWLRAVCAMPALCGGVAVLVFGFLIGRLTEPVPGMLGGVPWLTWLVLPLIVGAVVPSLVSAKRAALRLPRAGDRSEAFTLNTDIATAQVDDADQAGQRAAVVAFELVMSEAQREAETRLMAVVERIRKKAADQQTAELARVSDRHAEELRQARDNLEAQATAASERVRRAAAEHAAELTRMREKLARQYADNSRHATAVVESFEALTRSILQRCSASSASAQRRPHHEGALTAAESLAAAGSRSRKSA